MWLDITSGKRNPHTYTVFLICVFLLAAATGPVAIAQSDIEKANAPETTLLMGIFPFVSLSRIEEIFIPITIELQSALGRKIQIRTSSSSEKFVENLKEQAYDIAFIQPFDYVKTAAKVGYRPLLARKSPLTALIVVMPDSPISKINDLKGKVITIPPKGAAVSYLAAVSWNEAGLELELDSQPKHVRTHDSCLQLLLIGEASACVTSKGPLNLFESTADINFRVLTESPAIPGPLFVTHSRISGHERSILKNTLLTYFQSRSGTFWSKNNQGTLFKPGNDKDYDVVRKYLRYINE